MKTENSKNKLLQNIQHLIEEAQRVVVRNINTTMVFTYFQIGKMIIEDEQNGKDRAAYAEKTLAYLSKALTNQFGKGYSTSNLEYMRSFYITY